MTDRLTLLNSSIAGDRGALDTLLGTTLPTVTAAHNGELLGVVAGAWSTAANGFIGFTTTALRDAFAGLRTEGMLAYVSTTQCLYMLAPDLTTWNFFAPSPALLSQAAWYVDIGIGSDSNSGLLGQPLKTSEEVCRRLFPGGRNGLLTNAVTTINFAAGAYGDLTLNPIWPASFGNAGGLLVIECAYTASGPFTLSAVVNTTDTTVRGQLTIASGAFTAKGRIRSTSGAHVGAICYSTGQNASAQNHFVSHWEDYNSDSIVNIANGTTVTVDVLTVSFNYVCVRLVSNAGYVQIDNAKVIGAKHVADNDLYLVYYQGCEVSGFLDGTWTGYGCRVPPGQTLFVFESYAYFTGGCVQGTLEAAFGYFTFHAGGCVDGGKLIIGAPNFTNGDGSGINFLAATEFENGVAGNAITIYEGGYAAVVSPLWGLSASYGVGISMAGGTAITVNAAVATTNLAIPATQQMIMAGNNRTYAQMPGYYGRANCFVALASDTGAAFLNT